jgi:hypothetical protein
MCIYCGTDKYRLIYKNHHGDIPVDETGRKFDIHHIDGNHSNNDPVNLIAVTLKEHYDIHYQQGDFVACYLISRKLKLPNDEYSRLCSLSNMKRLKDGNHNLMKRTDGTSVASDMVINGTHPLLGKGLSHPKVDKTVYCFEHKITKERVNLTQYEFVRKYNIIQAHVSRMIHGKQKSTKKWILIRS